MKRFGLVVLWLAVMAALPAPSIAETRVALVIGNSRYVNVPSLDNPARDARMVADTLKGLGFRLVGGDAQFDLDKSSLDTAVRNFGREMQGADVGAFYYAGHGIQVRGSNYLVPVSANPTREADVDFELADLSRVLRQMEAAGTRLNLVMLDACRNNPFGDRGLRSADSGLAQMRAPEGTLISFATQPGNVAQDGSDGHSPYSRALVQTINKPGVGVFDAFNEVGLRVKKSTGGVQQPWVSSSPIDGSFYFAGMPKQDLPADVALRPDPAAAAIEAAPSAASGRPNIEASAPGNSAGKPAPSASSEKQNVATISPELPATQKKNEEKSSERGVAIYDGRYDGTISSSCPHEPGGIVTVRNGHLSGRNLSGTVSADGKVTAYGGIVGTKFWGKMQSPSYGSGGWSTSIGCTGRWTISRR